MDFPGCTRSKLIKDEMKFYIRNDSMCRRSLLLKVFGKVDSEKRKESCCDICAMGVSDEECFGLNIQTLQNKHFSNTDSEDSAEDSFDYRCLVGESCSDED